MEPLSASDEILYGKIKRGDLAAFDYLYERHQRGLFRLIYSYLKNREETEEVFHEAFIQVLKSAEVDFREGSFRGWLYLISRNLCLNRLRSRRRGEFAFQSLDSPTPEISAEDALIGDQAAQSLKASIGELPEGLSQVLNLRLSGLAHHEIAQVLSVPVGTVKSRFHHLVAHLKKSIRSHYE